MKIEAQSKYITIKPGVPSSHGDSRRVLLSLPRVKWLDSQPDYEPWPPLEPPRPSVAGKPINTRKFSFRPQTRSDKLSAMQQEAWDLHCSGKTHVQIGVEMNKTTNAVGKLIAQAREKLGISLK